MAIASTQDNRPFYGHALSDIDRRPLVRNEEVGPFYGHALPSEVLWPLACAVGLIARFTATLFRPTTSELGDAIDVDAALEQVPNHLIRLSPA